MRIWNWRSANMVAEAGVPADCDGNSVVFRARFAPDGRVVFAASAAGRVLRWDPQTAQISVAYQNPEGTRLTGSDVSADGSLIVAAGYFGGITFTTPAGRPAIRIPENATIYSCAISHDNRRAVLGCSSGAVRLVDIPSGMKSLELRHWYGHSARIEGIAMTREGGVALTASDDGTARLWDLNSVPGIGETLLFSEDEDRHRHNQPCVSPDGRWLATLMTDGDGFAIHLIDLRGGFERRTLVLHHDWTAHDTFLHSLQFSGNGDKLYAVTGREQPDRGICSWNLDPGTEPLSEPIYDVCAYRLLPDGLHAVVAHGLGSDRQISIWNLESNRIERTLVGGLEYVHKIGLMADRSSVIVCSESEYPRLIDLATGNQRLLDSTFADRVNDAVPHPVENRLVLIRESGSARWFDPSTMDVSAFPVAVEALGAIAFSRGGRLMASSARPGSGSDSRENRVALIDAASNHKLYALPTFSMSVDGIAWLPDGISLVVTFGAAPPGDPIIVIWNLSDPAHFDFRSDDSAVAPVEMPRRGE
jgi:WD40 repeat protein